MWYRVWTSGTALVCVPGWWTGLSHGESWRPGSRIVGVLASVSPGWIPQPQIWNLRRSYWRRWLCLLRSMANRLCCMSGMTNRVSMDFSRLCSIFLTPHWRLVIPFIYTPILVAGKQLWLSGNGHPVPISGLVVPRCVQRNSQSWLDVFPLNVWSWSRMHLILHPLGTLATHHTFWDTSQSRWPSIGTYHQHSSWMWAVGMCWESSGFRQVCWGARGLSLWL